MKVIRNIFVLVFTAVFLIPATGLYFVRHTCLHSGNSNLSLTIDSGCCQPEILSHSKETELGTSASTKSCLLQKTQEECCTYAQNYIKENKPYEQPVSENDLPFPGITVIVLPAHLTSNVFLTGTITYCHSPPYVPSGNYLLNSSFLL